MARRRCVSCSNGRFAGSDVSQRIERLHGKCLSDLRIRYIKFTLRWLVVGSLRKVVARPTHLTTRSSRTASPPLNSSVRLQELSESLPGQRQRLGHASHQHCFFVVHPAGLRVLHADAGVEHPRVCLRIMHLTRLQPILAWYSSKCSPMTQSVGATTRAV